MGKYSVNVLVDVRLKPKAWNRKWWGDKVKEFCEINDVKYISEPALGNISGNAKWIPPNKNEARNSLERMAAEIQNQTILLMCAELDHARCHRTEVANMLQSMTSRDIRHL